MKVVTAGSAYLDIDSYASMIGYAELLRLKGEEAIAASSAQPNMSVPASILGLDIGLDSYRPEEGRDDEFVLVDTSKPEAFDPITKFGKVIEVIDHHSGFDEYWQSRPDVKSDIRHIGAACTQIFERWQGSALLPKMRPATATMLAAGILDNTLNFKAGVTTDADRDAYEQLARIGDLPADYPARYFSECQAAIEADLAEAIHDDTKLIPEFPRLPLVLGQLTVWSPRELVAHKLDVFKSAMQERGEDWAMSIISLEEGKNYILATNPASQAKISALLGVEFSDQGLAVTDRLWLRKELARKSLES